jgi:Tfp pilus assembly protein PilF
MSDELRRERAIELWNEGLRHQQHGALDQAVKLYSKSIELCPTAEAYTYRGWAYHGMGRLEDAIAECHRAIEVDPTFGNPYNDIGAYLIEKADFDGAIEWLEKAKLAPRYEPRHFPFMNLGRVYAAKGMVMRAIEEFEGALELEPNEPNCMSMLAQLRAVLN